MLSEIQFTAVVPQFTVTDLKLTAAFYREKLGFQVESCWDGCRRGVEVRDETVFAIVRRDHVKLFFNRADGNTVRSGRAEGAYDCYFHIVGVLALAAEFKSKSVEILEGPDERNYGQRELVIRDCNGLVLAFGEQVH